MQQDLRSLFKFLRDSPLSWHITGTRYRKRDHSLFNVWQDSLSIALKKDIFQRAEKMF